MADYFQQSCRIVKMPDPPEPPTNAAEALEIADPYEVIAETLNDYGWGLDWGWSTDFTAQLVREAVENDEPFTVNEGRFDELENIGGVLSELGCSWYGWVEPKYEYPGTYYAYTPELGEFSADCDADGSVTVTEYTLRGWIDEAASLDELRSQIDRATGRAWHEALFPEKESEPV